MKTQRFSNLTTVRLLRADIDFRAVLLEFKGGFYSCQEEFFTGCRPLGYKKRQRLLVGVKRLVGGEAQCSLTTSAF